MAVSSRGLGRGPLKAQTRVRIPLPLLVGVGGPQSHAKNRGPVRLSVRTAPFHGAERGSIPLRAIVEGVERWNGGTVERWNGGTVERWNGGTVERWNGGTVERWNVNGDAVSFHRSASEASVRSTVPPLSERQRASVPPFHRYSGLQDIRAPMILRTPSMTCSAGAAYDTRIHSGDRNAAPGTTATSHSSSSRRANVVPGSGTSAVCSPILTYR